MNNKRKKFIYALLIFISSIFVIVMGVTFAYFSANIVSEDEAISLGAAVYKLDMKEDGSLIKSHIIPAEENVVDFSINRLDENGSFIKPYKLDNELIKKETVCVDDNQNEICSIYSFTIINPMTDIELPLYMTLNTTVNTFVNLYFKVVKIEKTDDGYKTVPLTSAIPIPGSYKLNDKGEYVYDQSVELKPIPLGVNLKLDKAIDENTPTEETLSIVIWIMENGKDQTIHGITQMIAGSVNINASGAEGNGITGIFTATGN